MGMTVHNAPLVMLFSCLLSVNVFFKKNRPDLTVRTDQGQMKWKIAKYFDMTFHSTVFHDYFRSSEASYVNTNIDIS